VLQQSRQRQGQHLGRDHHAFVTDGRAYGGNVLPTVSGAACWEADGGKAAGRHMPTHVADVGGTRVGGRGGGKLFDFVVEGLGLAQTEVRTQRRLQLVGKGDVRGREFGR